MKRILFIDDEPRILDGIRALLRKSRHRWDMSFAPGPEAALVAIGQQRFDVVVSDMRMPGMDGAEVLARVKEEQPGAARIVLSGHTEREAALRAVPVAHQFLPKPCDAGMLEMMIDRACGGPGLITDERLRGIIGGTYQLPSVSKTLRALLTVLDRPASSAGDIAAIIESDVAMSAKTLQLVNSAFFCLPRRVTSVRDAVVYLGLNAMRTMAVAAEAFTVMRRVPDSLVEQVRSRGLLAGRIARVVHPSIGDDAYTAAMLQDIGQLVLASCLPAEYAAVRERATREDRALDAVELEMLGATHAQVGAHLLALWGIPPHIVEGVAFSDTPLVHAGRTFDLAAVTHVAGCLAGEVGGAPGPDREWLAGFGVEHRLGLWRDHARQIAGQSMAAA